MQPITAEQRELYRRLETASKEAASKAVAGQTGINPQIIEDIAQDIVVGWLGKHDGRPVEADRNVLLEFARAEGILSAARKIREGEGVGGEDDLVRQLERQDASTLADISSDPETRCDFMPESNPILSKLRKSKSSSDRMYYILYRLHEGQRIFRGQPMQLSRRVRYKASFDNSNLPPEWCTDAQRDLLIYHMYSNKPSCPTCKRISVYIRKVTQRDVERTVNSILERIRLQADRI